MKTHFFLASTTAFALLLGLAGCGDKPADTNDETGTAGETATDTSADEVGESGTATTTSSDTSTTNDTDMTTSTTDTGNCPIGSEGCPCTEGGGCDPGLACEGGTCETPASTDTTDTTATDTTDTTTDTTDTGVDPLPYQACPNGDADCLPDEVCITGTANQGQLPWSMCTSGECGDDDECAFDDNDVCNDLPGDGEPIEYCVPVLCDMQNPCPDSMECAIGFGGGGATSVCVWPN